MSNFEKYRVIPFDTIHFTDRCVKALIPDAAMVACTYKRLEVGWEIWVTWIFT